MCPTLTVAGTGRLYCNMEDVLRLVNEASRLRLPRGEGHRWGGCGFCPVDQAVLRHGAQRRETQLEFRLTMSFHKRNGRWYVVREHHSRPAAA
jgi:ketosteroid isomerase-like protein